MEWMAYMVMEHYGWTLEQVNRMNMNELRQSVSWAIAMNRKAPASTQGEIVHLGYDRVPTLEGDESW